MAAHIWRDKNHPVPTACLIAVDNTPSLKLAAALGYREIDRLERGSSTRIVLERNPKIKPLHVCFARSFES